MDFDVLAAAAVQIPRPFGRERVHKAAETADPTPRAAAVRAAATVAPAPPRRVELSFHEDLKVLMTRVVDVQTGDLVREYPVRQVLDMVADVIARMRAREGGRS